MSTRSTPDLDATAVENLRALGEPGDDTFLKEIVSIYLEDTPARLADLRKALAESNQALYTRTAHTIKGSSANVGTSAVRLLAEQLEHRSKAEPAANLESLRLELEQAYARAEVALRALIA